MGMERKKLIDDSDHSSEWEIQNEVNLVAGRKPWTLEIRDSVPELELGFCFKVPKAQ